MSAAPALGAERDWLVDEALVLRHLTHLELSALPVEIVAGPHHWRSPVSLVAREGQTRVVIENHPPGLDPHPHVDICYGDDGSHFRFTGTATQHGRLLTIAPPALVHCTDSYRSRRLIPCPGAGLVAQLGGAHGTACEVVDISLAGLQLVGSGSEPGQSVLLQLRPASGPDVELMAVCRWNRGISSWEHTAGYTFLSPTAEDIDALAALVACARSGGPA